VHRVTGLTAIDAYFARLDDDRVLFEQVQV
jgi:hypothetical protein